jgi:hypothetical protein
MVVLFRKTERTCGSAFISTRMTLAGLSLRSYQSRGTVIHKPPNTLNP